MEVISKSVFNIDYEEGRVIKRDIPDYFNEYIDNLIEFTDRNERVRLFKARSQSTQVISNIRNIIIKSYDNDAIELNHTEIVERLLAKEVERQEIINRMKISIKKGSIIQALIKEEDNNCYKYIIAKVDCKDFIDNDDLKTKIGFLKENKAIGKTCILETASLEEDDIIIDNAKIYLDGSATYWADEFLELDEMRCDELNTKLVFDSVESVLKRYIFKKSPKDYNILRNSLIGTLRTRDHIDYNTNIIKEIVCDYVPEDNESLTKDTLDTVVEKLKELPEKKNFDLQFTPMPRTISAKVKKIYPVTPGIEIKTDYVEGLKDVIKSFEEPDGTRYLKIKTTNDETYGIFK